MPKPRPTSRPRPELLGEIGREGRRIGASATMHNHACAELVGVHPTDWECLDVLDWTGPIPAGRLAELTGLTTGAVTGVIDRLERAEFVRRVRDPHDRRVVIIEPVHGRDAELEGAFEDFGRAMSELAERFTVQQLAVVLEWMRGTNDALYESTLRLRARVRDRKAAGQ